MPATSPNRSTKGGQPTFPPKLGSDLVLSAFPPPGGDPQAEGDQPFSGLQVRAPRGAGWLGVVRPQRDFRSFLAIFIRSQETPGTFLRSQASRGHPLARPLHFLLESLGFPPGTDFVRLAGAVSKTEVSGRTFEFGCGLGLHGSRRGEAPRANAYGKRLHRTAPERADGLWPSFRGAAPVRFEVESVAPAEEAPRFASLQGRLGEVGSSSTASVPIAWMDSAAPAAGEIRYVHLCGFAIDVESLGFLACPPRFSFQPGTARQAASFGRFERPLDLGAPRNVIELDLNIDRVFVLENPLTHESFDLVEVLAPGGRLPLFVSRWQLEEDGLPAPEPGMRIRGAFWLCANGERADRVPDRQVG